MLVGLSIVSLSCMKPVALMPSARDGELLLRCLSVALSCVMPFGAVMGVYDWGSLVEPMIKQSTHSLSLLMLWLALSLARAGCSPIRVGSVPFMGSHTACQPVAHAGKWSYELLGSSGPIVDVAISCSVATFTGDTCSFFP